MFLNLMAKSMWVVFHPHEQGRSGFVRVGASGRAGLDPLADEIRVELPKAAAGVIEFIGLGMAAHKKLFKPALQTRSTHHRQIGRQCSAFLQHVVANP